MLAARLLLAVAAGLVAGIAFEPLALAYALPVAVALLTAACHGLGPGRGFLAGSCFGISFMLVLLPWLQVIGTDAWIGLSILQGLFYGLLGMATSAVVRLPWWPLWAAAAWTGVELLRGTVPFGGFPWGRLSFATVDTPFAPLFATVGAAGVSFAVALVGVVLAWAVLRLRQAPVRAVGAVVATVALVALASVTAPVTGQGDEAGDEAGEEPATLTVAAVQGDVPGVGMNAFAERRAVLDNHVAATRRLATRIRSGEVTRPAFVVWPENSTDIDPFQDPTVYDDIQAAVDAVGVPILVGALVDGPEPDEVLNQGIVWEPSRGPVQRYSKNHPVPFGEYIPFRDQIAQLVTRLDQIPRDMRPGRRPGLLDLGGTPVGDLICFEVAYDDLLRGVVRGGAEMVVVQTNNATYMGTGQIEQQFAITRLRAIETGKTVVVAATNGVSGVVNPDGEVTARAPVRTQQVLVESVSPTRGVTTGIRFGAWIELGLAVVAALALFAALVLRRRDRRPPSVDRAEASIASRTPVRTG